MTIIFSPEEFLIQPLLYKTWRILLLKSIDTRASARWPPNENEIEPDSALYFDSHSLYETKGNDAKFKLIVDMLIDIVEKIEAYPSLDEQLVCAIFL